MAEKHDLLAAAVRIQVKVLRLGSRRKSYLWFKLRFHEGLNPSSYKKLVWPFYKQKRKAKFLEDLKIHFNFIFPLLGEAKQSIP